MAVLKGRSRLWSLLGSGLVLVLLAAGLHAAQASGAYRLRLVIPEAAGVYEGMSIRMKSSPIGTVDSVGVRDGKAVVEITVDDEHAPLRKGTKPIIDYRSLVGEVYLQLSPGPSSAASLPSGSTVQTDWSQVAVEDVLETLDPATRRTLSSLLKETSTALSGRTAKDLNATIKSAGPAVDALAQLLKALAVDGPALRELVTKLDKLMAATATRREALHSSVEDLSSVAEELAGHHDQLRSGLSELPGTLSQTRKTLRNVEPTVEEATPLLKDLQPVAAQLPGVSAELAPLLSDLRPMTRDLRGTLDSANVLLGETPALLDSAGSVVPQLDRTLAGLAPALNFLRPYTPDLVGWLSNWAGVFGTYTSQGHAGHLLATASATGVNNLPKIAVPGMTFDDTTAPGTSAGQPWTDASGEDIR